MYEEESKPAFEDDARLRILEQYDAYAETIPGFHERVSVRDEDGGYLFGCTVGISAADLQTIFSFGRARYAQGERAGKADMQVKFRALIGVPAPPAEDE